MFTFTTYCGLLSNVVAYSFLVSKVDESKADLQESLSIDPTLTQTWVKIASVHMEQGNPPAAFEAFEEAITQDANDPDIYYHRGQGMCP